MIADIYNTTKCLLLMHSLWISLRSLCISCSIFILLDVFMQDSPAKQAIETGVTTC